MQKRKHFQINMLFKPTVSKNTFADGLTSEKNKQINQINRERARDQDRPSGEELQRLKTTSILLSLLPIRDCTVMCGCIIQIYRGFFLSGEDKQLDQHRS